MRTRVLSIFMLVSILTILAPASAAPADDGRGGHGHEARMERMFDLLDVDDGQRDQLQQIFSEKRSAAEGRHEAVDAAHRALGEQVHAEVFDETAIRAAAAKLAGVEADLAVEKATMLQ